MNQPLSFRKQWALASAGGIAYFLAFPGMDVWPLAFICWIPLLIASDGQSARRHLFLGWWMGTLSTAFGFYWILDMLTNFSGFPLPVCLIFAGLLASYHGLRFGGAMWLARRVEEKTGQRFLGWLGGFVLFEFLMPLLFPWFYGASVHQLTALIQIADLGGPILVGAVLLAFNYGCYLLYRAIAANRRLGHPSSAVIKDWRKHSYALALLALTPLGLVYGWLRLSQVESAIAAAPSLHIGIVQANMGIFEKHDSPTEGVDRHIRLSKELVRSSEEAQDPLDFIVWSETSAVQATFVGSEDLSYGPLAQIIGVPLIIGAVLVESAPPPRNFISYNTALQVEPNGTVSNRYDKRYLVPFGEYLPWGEEFPELYELSPQTGRFQPGKLTDAFNIAGSSVSVDICYEDVVPSYMNRLINSHPHAEAMINLTNDAWYGDTTEPWIHLALAKFRSIEHRRALVRSVNSGVSAFISPTGEVLKHTKAFEQTTLSGRIPRLKGRTVFEVLGDIPWYAISLLAVLAAFLPRRFYAKNLEK